MIKSDSSWIKRTLPLWIGQFISLFGSGIVQFSIVWYLTEITGSKVILALASYMAVIPGVLLGSTIGHFVDKNNKKLTMIIADIISAVSFKVQLYLLQFHNWYLINL